MVHVWVGHSYSVLGVTISSNTYGQTLFYQVNLGDTRDNTGCPTHGSSCSPQAQSWYATSNPFGVSDSPANFGAPCLRMSQASPGAVRVKYELDVLPKLLAALERPPAHSNLGTDPAHWFVSSMYIGIGSQGSVDQTMVIEEVDLVTASRAFSIPEIGLESAKTEQGGAAITVLELLQATKAEVTNSPAFQQLDQAEGMVKLMEFVQQLDEVIEGTMDATLVLEDTQDKMAFIEVRDYGFNEGL
ncbi:uncharacterized protein MONBRDRAFT_6354, partial [Monosiga brevicollis MX1]